MAKIRTNRTAKQQGSAKSSPAISTLEDILSNKQSPIDTKQLAYQFMREIGGGAGFVSLVMIEYNGSAVGSLARSRVLDIMLKLFQLASPSDGAGDHANVSDEDLIRVFHEKLGRAAPSPMAPKPDEGWITDVVI